jgi:hypothetical protein
MIILSFARLMSRGKASPICTSGMTCAGATSLRTLKTRRAALGLSSSITLRAKQIAAIKGSDR